MVIWCVFPERIEGKLCRALEKLVPFLAIVFGLHYLCGPE